MSMYSNNSDVERGRGDVERACLPCGTLGPAERRHRFDPSYASHRCVCGRERLNAMHMLWRATKEQA